MRVVTVSITHLRFTKAYC